MRPYYFTFRSVTAAMQGQAALAKAGIRAYLSRTPSALKDRGCGYVLKVMTYPAAEAILSRGEKRYLRCFYRLENGLWQEVEA